MRHAKQDPCNLRYISFATHLPTDTQRYQSREPLRKVQHTHTHKSRAIVQHAAGLSNGPCQTIVAVTSLSTGFQILQLVLRHQAAVLHHKTVKQAVCDFIRTHPAPAHRHSPTPASAAEVMHAMAHGGEGG